MNYVSCLSRLGCSIVSATSYMFGRISFVWNQLISCGRSRNPRQKSWCMWSAVFRTQVSQNMRAVTCVQFHSGLLSDREMWIQPSCWVLLSQCTISLLVFPWPIVHIGIDLDWLVDVLLAQLAGPVGPRYVWKVRSQTVKL